MIVTSLLKVCLSQAPEGDPGDSNSDFDQYTRSGSVEAKSLVWKQDLRILPLCSVLYLLNFLDRSNIGND